MTNHAKKHKENETDDQARPSPLVGHAKQSGETESAYRQRVEREGSNPVPTKPTFDSNGVKGTAETYERKDAERDTKESRGEGEDQPDPSQEKPAKGHKTHKEHTHK